MKLKHILKATVLGTSLSLIAGATQAAQYEWRYASAAPEGTPWVKHSEKLRDALVEALDKGVGISPFSDGLKPSLKHKGRGPGPGPGWTASWITMTSSLLCWPRCSLAKSKPFTLGACN